MTTEQAINAQTRLKKLRILIDQLHECFNAEIFSIEIKVGVFDELGEVKDYHFDYHKPYQDKQNFEPVPEKFFKEFLQNIFVEYSFESQLIKFEETLKQ